MKKTYRIIATIDWAELGENPVSALIGELNYHMGGFGFHERLTITTEMQIGTLTVDRPLDTRELAEVCEILDRNYRKGVPGIVRIELGE